MLSRYARNECLAASAVAVALAASCFFFGVPALIPLPLLAGAALLLFYRDPKRLSPKDRNVAVSPADGKVSSVHEVAHFEPFDGPAVCVRVFLSAFDVHVNYCPCHALVHSITHKPGEHLGALNPRSAEANESTTTVFFHPTHKTPLVAVRQITGLLARTAHCALAEGQVVQRGSKLGIMKLGSTAELYVPGTLDQVLVRQGQRVVGAVTPLAVLPSAKASTGDLSEDSMPVTALSEHPPAPVVVVDDMNDADGAQGEASACEPVLPASLEAALADPPELPDEPILVATDTAIIPSHSILPAEPDMAEASADLTDHAITQLMEAHEVTDTSHVLTAAADGEILTARMENAGTDLMLHPAEHGEENASLAASLAGLRPEAHTDMDDALNDVLTAQRQPGADLSDTGDWKIIPTSKKPKKPKADGLLWEDLS